MSRVFFPLSLKSRLILFVFIVAFVPLLIVTSISLRYSEQITKSILYSHLHSITQNKAKAISRWVSERVTDVLVIADSRALRSMEVYEIDSYIESMKSHYLDYRRILLVDLQGKVVADTADKKENYKDADWFRAAMEKGRYISNAFWEGNELMFLIATDVGENEPVGVLCEFIDLEYLNRFATDMSLGASGESYLINNDGFIIAHKDRNRVLRDKTENFDLLTRLSESGTGLEVYRNYRGIEVMGAQTWVPQQAASGFLPIQWLLVAEQDTKEVFATVNRYRVGIIILFLALSSTIVLGCILISQTIVRPIKDLADATDAIAGGNFNKRLEVKRQDEVGRLTIAFNQMADQLRSYYARLENRLISSSEELEKVSSELEKSKETLARSEKLVALGQVSAGVAHEIRTPLTSIRLFIQSMETFCPSDDETLEDFTIIKGEIGRMEEIINRFLSFARPATPKFESANINNLLAEAISLVKTRLAGGEIVIEAEYDEDISLISVDRQQLKQVFLNMLLNSVEAMPEHGKITVTTNLISVSSEHEGLIKITITDTGHGIDAASRRYIFDPFFTTKDSGTGMGLAIAFTIIEQHGGVIEVESEPSKGATFIIYLPSIRGGTIEQDTNS